MKICHLRYTTVLIAVLIFAFASGCGSTERVILSNNLSSDFQVRLNTAEQYESSFEFNSKAEAEEITVSDQRTSSQAKVIYSINDPLRGRLMQLMRTKFGSISESSENSVRFTVEDVTTREEDGVHQVEMSALIEIEREGETFTRRVSRSATAAIEPVSGNMQSTITLDEATLDEFIMQFVAATDSFINSNFGVD